MHHTTPTYRRCLLISILIVLASNLFLIVDNAHANLSSGLPSGPVGSPVMSTADYVSRSDVLIVGDSLTVRAYKTLAADLPGQRLAVNAWSGRNTKLAVDSLLLQVRAGLNVPRRVIMATGSNDVFAPGVMPAQIKRLLAGLPKYVEVYWVNVSVLRPGYLFADRVNSRHVNDAIRANCTGRCSVIDWAGTLAKVKRSTYIDAGGVHQTAPGKALWANLIAWSIR